MSEIKKVYQAINNVQSALSKVGVSKDQTNKFDGYNFRGIDDIYNALAPKLAEFGLCILPRVLKREVAERQSNKGLAMFYVVVEAEFDFVCAEDGSIHTVKTFGEAMDRSDKATNKAMSAAYKYACFQAFSIPTHGDNDADAETPEVQAWRPTTDQVIQLDDLIVDTKTDKKALLAHYKVSNIEAMSEKAYSHAITALKKKQQENNQ